MLQNFQQLHQNWFFLISLPLLTVLITIIDLIVVLLNPNLT